MNQVDTNKVGNSMIIGPMGVIISRIGEKEGIIVSKIDSDRIKKARGSLPVLKNRKPKLYNF